MVQNNKRVIIAEPRSFCAGVRRAISIIELALERYGPPIYVRKEIVHNHYVVRLLEQRGARFVASESDVPEGAVCVFSAHGVAPEVRVNAASRGLDVIDATCPLVSKVHTAARKFAKTGRTLLLVGHAEHEEVVGTYGEAPQQTLIVETVEDVARLTIPDDTPVAFLTQTTLSMDETKDILAALRARFTDLAGPEDGDICYASQNRQNAIKAIARLSDVVLVVGSHNSSNSVRMVEVSRALGTPAYLVPEPADLQPAWLDGATVVGVSAGASAPEVLVEWLLDRLADLGYTDVELETTVTEDVVFATPARLTSPVGK
ncbi:MAG: 4-hydroxy-3-methylbut-2-enyl diphosphate reductase [Streptosporangiaceae bacterium]